LSANAIARRYAKALVQLAAEEGAVESFHGELARVEELFAANPELGSLLSNPAHGIEAKLEVLKDVAGKLTLSGTIRNFLLLLQERNRMTCLPAISSSYSILADELRSSALSSRLLPLMRRSQRSRQRLKRVPERRFR
jgi:F-type H+-transporting ATPase subunit delta